MQVSKNQCYAGLWFRKYLSSKCKCNSGTYNPCNCIKPLPHLCTCEYITLNINCNHVYMLIHLVLCKYIEVHVYN